MTSPRASDFFTATFADRFKLAMDSEPWTLREWSEIHGFAFGTVHKVRNGHVTPGLERAAAYADALNVSLDWLTGRTEDPGRPLTRAEGISRTRSEAIGL